MYCIHVSSDLSVNKSVLEINSSIYFRFPKIVTTQYQTYEKRQKTISLAEPNLFPYLHHISEHRPVDVHIVPPGHGPYPHHQRHIRALRLQGAPTRGERPTKLPSCVEGWGGWTNIQSKSHLRREFCFQIQRRNGLFT